MKDVKKILAALCLSDKSPRVYDHAAQLAKAFDVELVVLNVLNVRSVQDVTVIESMGYNVHSDDYSKNVKTDRLKQIQNIIDASDIKGINTRTMVRVGHPAEMILKVIDEEKVDLVVIGVVGQSNVSHFFVGSVAEKIFRHSPVTVVSCRDPR